MQPYQNYMSSPYQYNQWQQYQPQQIAPQVQESVRYVDDFNSITANDVSMSGMTTFVKRDLTEIQTRTWLPNGTIGVTSYKPILGQNDAKANNLSSENEKSLYGEISKKFDAIMERLDLIEKPKARNTRKEAENE